MYNRLMLVNTGYRKNKSNKIIIMKIITMNIKLINKIIIVL